MSHFGYVSEYDPNAPLPTIGSRWAWEIDEPNAREITEVTAVKWNGEAWWVETKTLLPNPAFPSDRDKHWNEIGRFWEAVTIIGGGITGASVVRRPNLARHGVEGELLEAVAR